MKAADGRLLPRPPGRHRVRDVALAGAVLVGSFALAITISLTRHQAAAARTVVSQGPATSASSPAPPVPTPDLAAAGLAQAAPLVTPLWLDGHRGGAGITLIGAYADSAQIVMFFRGLSPGPPSFFVYDDQTWLNSYTGGGQGIPGDAYSSLATSPHVAEDGLAHLTITDSAPPTIRAPTKPVGSQWFSFAIKVQPGVALAAPATFPLGSWQIKVEKLEATPTLIVLQAVIDGASPEDIGNAPVTLSDAGGNLVRTMLGGAGVTVPKQQLSASNYKHTRITYQWFRPASAGIYQLRFTGNGTARTLALSVPGRS